MRSFWLHTLVTALALIVADWLLAGVQVHSTLSLVLAAVVLGLVNGFVRPVLTFLTLPATLLTLGLFYLVVNGVAFALAAALVPGFTVASFGSAIAGAFVVSAVSWLFGALALRAAVQDA